MQSSDRAAGRQYQDFELTVVAARAPHTYRVTARGSSGQADGRTTLDPASDEWRTPLDALAEDDLDEDLLIDLGARLFDALFPGDVEDAYRASMGYAQGEGQDLRLRLRLTQAPEIAALPWEYVYDRQRDLFLGVSNDTLLSRFIEPQQVFPPPPPPVGKLRFLTVVSDPRDLDQLGFPPLDVEAELRTIDQALERLKSRGLLEPIKPLRHAVRADISEALREYRPHVLHFIGHGSFEQGQGKLILEDADHYALEMSDRAFRELLGGHPETRLVTLNACQGATRASGDAMVGIGPRLVGRGVPAVVAMQYAVHDRAAISFAREFYRALTHWHPIDLAVSQARRAVYLDYGLDRRDWGAPVLFMRDRDGLLFEPPETTPTIKASTDDAPVSLSIDPASVNPIRLRKAMLEVYDKPGLVTLCSDLAIKYDDRSVEYDSLRGESLSNKVLYLIDWHRRRRRMADLVRKVVNDYPFLADELA